MKVFINTKCFAGPTLIAIRKALKSAGVEETDSAFDASYLIQNFQVSLPEKIERNRLILIGQWKKPQEANGSILIHIGTLNEYETNTPLSDLLKTLPDLATV